MLGWSELDPDSPLSADEATALIDELASQMSDDEYEAKVAGLLQRAYQRDVGSDTARKAIWKTAYAKLNEGDHYIVVMLDRALGRKLRSSWLSWL